MSALAVFSQAITISSLLDPAAEAPAGSWVRTGIAGGGSAALVSLVGEGGDLESNQPGQDGAVRLATGFSNDDEARVVTYDDFGDAAVTLADLEVGFSYFKQTVDGGNVFAAPALRIGIESASGTGDNSGELVYEPYWNQPGGGAPAAPADAWQTVSIFSATGGGNPDNQNLNGGWWWDGGFEVSNSFGGPPLRSLEEWVTVFEAADAVDFGTARMVSVGFSVGSYNQGQIGYVDNLSIAVPGSLGVSYDFSAVPEPAEVALGVGMLAGLGAWTVRRRQRRVAAKSGRN